MGIFCHIPAKDCHSSDPVASAALREQHRHNVFKMNVANVLPGDEVLEELRYLELIVPTDLRQGRSRGPWLSISVAERLPGSR